MESKACTKCKVVKSTSEFEKFIDRRTHTPRLVVRAVCLVCLRRQQNEYYRKHAQRIGLYVKKRRLLGLMKKHSYKKSSKARQSERKSKVKAAMANPLKARCKWNTKHYIRKGWLKKQPCQICNEQKTHAHHSDYNRPWDVQWLCSAHHRAWHRVFRATDECVSAPGRYGRTATMKKAQMIGSE